MSRIDIVRSKFPKFVDQALTIGDPTKSNKYLLWIADQLSRGHTIPDIKGTVEFFHKYNAKFQERDIYKYEDLKTLEDLCKAMPESKRKMREDLKEYGSEKILDNDKLQVVRVDTKAAMILYGANTKWCTVSKDSTYYEEYVSQGNDFYIAIFKNGMKYAIVRKSLISFEVFSATDKNMRSFRKNEEEILHDVIAAVAADKPKDNMLRVILANKNSLEKVKGLNEWLAVQLPSTMKFLVARVPNFEDLSLLKIGKDGQALMDFLMATSVAKLSKLKLDQKKEVVKFLEEWNAEGTKPKTVAVRPASKKPRKETFRSGPYSIRDNFAIYNALAKYFSREFLLKFRSHSNYKYRIIAADNLDFDDVKQMLDDKASTVINTIIEKLSPKQLLDLSKSDSISSSTKEFVIKRFESSIDANDLVEVISSKPTEDLLRLIVSNMLEQIIKSKGGQKFLFDKLSDDEKEKLIS